MYYFEEFGVTQEEKNPQDVRVMLTKWLIDKDVCFQEHVKIVGKNPKTPMRPFAIIISFSA